jgi:large subunit ribosomal protein L17
MRHRKSINHLGRTSAHRKAMLSNMASSLILHKRITTTTAKAKALRSYIEPLITKSKDDTTHSRRVVFSYLKNKYAVSELFREVSPKIIDRPGGYTRILKTGSRLGDNAEMCIIELVDYNENMLEDTAKKTRSSKRRRGSGKAKAEASASAEATADKKAEVEEEVTAEEEIHDEEEVKNETEAEVGESVSTSVEDVPEQTKVEDAITDDVEASPDDDEVKAETTTAAEEVKSGETTDVEDLKSEQEKDKKEKDTKEGETVSKAEAKDSSKVEGEEKKTEEENPEDTDKDEDKKE